MKMKKTWFSYLLWVLYTMIAGILLATYITTVSIHTWGLNKYVTTAMICLFFVGTVAIWLAGRKLIPYIIIRIPKDKHFRNMWECFLVLCLFAASILYRFHYMMYASDIVVKTNTFYEMAKVTEVGVIPYITHGASYIYTVLLSVIFSFMGNKVMAGVVLQFIFQFLIMLFGYLALRLLTGRSAAFIAMLFMAFSPAFVGNLFSLTPEGLYLLLYVAGLWGISLFLNNFKNIGNKSKGSYIIFIIIGIYIGLMSYLDIIGFTLLFFAGLGLLLVREKDVKEIKAGGQFVVILLAVIAAVAAMMALDAIYSNLSFQNILDIWLNQYHFLQISDNIPYLLMGFDIQSGVGIILCMIALLSSVGFWVNKEQRIDPWILLLLVLSAINLTGISQMSYHIMSVFLWGVFGGLGLASIGMGVEAQCNADNQNVIARNDIANIISDMDETEIEDVAIEDTFTEEKTDKVKLLDNPLPLPKKHVKKEMDYGVTLADQHLDYDVSIKEDDDFDI